MIRNTLLLTAVLVLVVAGIVGFVHPATAMPNPTMPEPDERAFYRLWERTDAPVLNKRVERTWYWGKEPLATFDEPYLEGPNGTRRVQYWDKGRMEISNPRENPENSWYVTAGRLSIEMIGGRIQAGDERFEEHPAATIPIAGDPNPDNAYAPTYASFASVTSSHTNGSPQDQSFAIIGSGLGGEPVLPRYGDLVDETLDVWGNVGNNPDLATAYPGTRLVYYDEVLGHNIPDVFWNFLQKVDRIQINGVEQRGLLIDWLHVMGRPASEPYWIRTKVNHIEQDILVQVFERRVLTYNPHNPPGWEVEMGNIGQHYYKWRYGEVETPNLPAQHHANQVTTHSVARPANFTASAQPGEGPAGTHFSITLSGFRKGEKVSIWVTLPDQSVIAAPDFGKADALGNVQLFDETPFPITTQPGDPTGVWAVSGYGNTSNRKAIAYFTVTNP